MSSTINAETYGQMANMSSGSCGSQQVRGPFEFIDEREESSDAAVYNFPWDVKLKASQLLVSTTTQTAAFDTSKSVAQRQKQQQPEMGNWVIGNWKLIESTTITNYIW